MISVLALLSLCLCSVTSCFVFAPRSGPNLAEDVYGVNAPVLVNVSTSLTLDGKLGGSYWSSSFLHASDDNDYMIISHTLVGSNTSNIPTYYRASILNISGAALPDAYTQNTSSVVPENLSNNTFSIIYPYAGFEALSSDNVSSLHTWSNQPEATFDLVFNSTAPILYNGGLGSFQWGPSATYEWSMTSARTSGSLTMNNQILTIDPDRSLTWFDRQWSVGQNANNWTWFEIHLDNSETKLSVWVFDNDEPFQRNRFATIKYINGSQQLSQVTFEPNYTRTYDSNNTGIIYPLDWTLGFGGNDILSVSSIRPDQEILADVISNVAYEGFGTISGSFQNQNVTSYTCIEMVRNS